MFEYYGYVMRKKKEGEEKKVEGARKNRLSLMSICITNVLYRRIFYE